MEQLQAIAELIDSGIEFKEYKVLINAAITPYKQQWGDILLSEFSDSIEFAAKKKRNCTPGKSFACGNSCQPLKTRSGKKTKCRKKHDEGAKEAQDFLKSNDASTTTKQQSGSGGTNQESDQSAPTTEIQTEFDERTIKSSKRTGFPPEESSRILDLTDKYKNNNLTEKEEKELRSLNQRYRENKRKVFDENFNEIDIDSSIASRLKGGRVILESEINSIGKSSEDFNSLTKDDVKKINSLRNGFPNQKEFLDEPPNIVETKKILVGNETQEFEFNDASIADREIVLYQSDRVVLTVSKDGDVEFSVDGATNTEDRDSGDVPSNDLRRMARSFQAYLNSPAGKRKLVTVPTSEDGKGATRAKLYQKRGFQVVEGNINNINETNSVLMVLDNRIQDEQ